ncbi:MAG: TrkH family potassium uptake protein [Clostridia bacterium]|nr:TrkH family potassium uptake protein [Clostridia bacterium]
MNRRMVFYTVGHIATVEAALLLLPALVSLIYLEKSGLSFLITAALSLTVGLAFILLFKPKSRMIYAKEGFAIVAYAWLLMSAIGALPFVIGGAIPSYVDAFFETVSGFTTTGASILTDVEALDHCMLFWRSFTHWIGGMGVLVLVTAVVPNIADRSLNILKAEMPGPTVGKLVPRSRDTAKILYWIYFGMTFILTVLLIAGGMPVFDSIVHAFGTAGTGGFGIKADSIASYSPYLQWVITIFMFLFAINFNLYYLILIGKFRAVLKSDELSFFILLVLSSVGVIAVNILPAYASFSEALRASAFQVCSIVSTTGYATADFNLWPGLSKAILLILMFVGGCAGSTGGGLKAVRVVILIKSIKKELKKLLHPRSVKSVMSEGKKLDDETLSGVTSYFAVYTLCIMVVFLLLSFEPFGFETNFTASVACFNNIGPGLADVGPAASFAQYSDFSKIVLSFAMLLGRLEVFPLLLGLNPLIWKRSKGN